MTKYNSDTCRICEFAKFCLKSYGNPHDGCTNKFKESKQKAHELVIQSAVNVGKELEQKKTAILLDALKVIRKDIRNRKSYLTDDVFNMIDSTAMNAIHDYLKNEIPAMGNKND